MLTTPEKNTAGLMVNAAETVVNLVTLGGVVYVATTIAVYRVDGDRLVRLTWPPGPTRGRGERKSGRQRKRKEG